MRITSRQRAFFALLREAEDDGRKVARSEILAATGYKAGSFDTNLGKGLYSRFLSEVSEGVYEVTGTRDLSIEHFVQLTTQSLFVRELGYFCKSRLAKALLRKSRDNMVLALELYNRPTLDNRLDAFGMLFCAAWEQLLKAKLIEEEGEAVIFKPRSGGGLRRTIGLQQCLERLPASDPVRRNLEKIKFLRDQATHLTMPEVQGVASYLFQAGVLNYSREFREFTHEPFIPNSPLGLLSLVADTRRPTPVHLQGAYGEQLGAEILELVSTLEQAIDGEKDERFAIPLEFSLVLARKPGKGDIVLANAADAARDAAVIYKTRDHRDTHPYRTEDAIRRVNEELRARLRPEDLGEHLPGRVKKSGKPTFNSYDFSCIAWKEKWKAGDKNPFHVALTDRKPIIRQYSEAAVDFIVRKIVDDPSYLTGLRGKYHGRRKSTSKRK